MTTKIDDETGEVAPPRRGPKTFLQTLQDHHYGYTAEECTTLMREAIDAAERTGKATEFTVKMKFRPASKAQGRYDVLVEPSNKLPPKQREAAIMFVGPDGNLTNKDPRQMEIDGLRVVDKPIGAVRVDADEPQTAQRVG